MNHKRRFAAATAAVALGVATLTSTARAAQPGFYVGGFYGQSDKDSDIRDYDSFGTVFIYPNPAVDLDVESMTSTLDTKDSGFGFLAGYRFNSHLAIEGGYIELGSVSYRANLRGNIGGSIPTDAVFNIDSETSGLTLSAVGVWPLSYRWEVYGRAGALFSSNEVTFFYDDVDVGSIRERFSESDVDFFAGLGTSFNFLEIYDLRLEYQRIIDAGDKSTDEADADVISIGITVVF